MYEACNPLEKIDTNGRVAHEKYLVGLQSGKSSKICLGAPNLLEIFRIISNPEVNVFSLPRPPTVAYGVTSYEEIANFFVCEYRK